MRVAGIVLACTVTACSTVLGIEELPRGVDAGLTFEFTSAACAQCVETNCAAAADACIADPTCSKVYRCVAKCAPSDLACRAACRQLDEVAFDGARFIDVDSCWRRSCSIDCYGAGGAGASHQWSKGSDCACVDSACHDQMLACVRSGHDRPGERIGMCEREFACFLGSPDPDVGGRCQASIRAGDAEISPLRSCVNTKRCATCPVGADFRCHGAFQYTPLPVTTLTLPYHLKVTTSATLQPIRASARACADLDCRECKNGVDLGMSSAEGVLDANLPLFRGSFDGCIHLAADGYLPLIWYGGRKLAVEESAWFALMSDRATVDLLAAALMTKPQDATLGGVVGAVYDCQMYLASDIAIDDIGGVKVGYFDVGPPFRASTDATFASGSWAAFNVPPGEHSVVARRKSDGQEVSRYKVAVAAGAITSLYMFPTPRAR